MSKTRARKEKTKAQKAEQSLETKIKALEELIGLENPETQNIHFLLNNIRNQGNQLQMMNQQMQQYGMEIGFHNAFLQTQELEEAFAEFKKTTIDNAKTVTPEEAETMKKEMIAKKIANDEKRIVNEADESDEDADEVINDAVKKVVNDE